MMFRGILGKLISLVSLLVTSAGDLIVTNSGDNILISASPFSDLSGTISVEENYVGKVEAVDLITGTIKEV